MSTHAPQDEVTTEAAHLAWEHARDQTTLGPGGLAELASTTWLSTEPRPIADLPGRWSARDGVVRSEGAARSEGAHRIVLAPGDTDVVAGVRVAAFARDGELALRAYETGRAARLGMIGIDRHPFDPAMRVAARVTRVASEPTPTEAVDGHRSTTVYDVALALTVRGADVTLLAHDEGESLFAAFSDAAHPDAFRMLRIPCAPARTA
ncbi:hypothetical protein [Demequina salsinemoris]|uniref:hypothetical protein n=1 Tax=Demequina salsinemoris TaxID=577470 RepID=UPI00078380BA|nr:hypothetical protein [Demequina salsinemoris]